MGHEGRGIWPTLVSSIQGVNVRSVHCGYAHTICVTGKCRICSANSLTLFFSEDMGKLIAFGQNVSGELGLGHFNSPQKQPTVVDTMEVRVI